MKTLLLGLLLLLGAPTLAQTLVEVTTAAAISSTLDANVRLSDRLQPGFVLTSHHFYPRACREKEAGGVVRYANTNPLFQTITSWVH